MSLLWHNDGQDWLCSKCCKVVPRTRSNPFPEHVCKQKKTRKVRRVDSTAKRGKERAVVRAWAILNNQGGFAILNDRMPLFWYKRTALKRAEEYGYKWIACVELKVTARLAARAAAEKEADR